MHRCRNKPSSSSSSRVPSNSMKQKKSVQNTFRLSALVLVPWDGRVCVLVRPSELYAIKKTHHGFSFRRAVNAYGRTANDADVSVRSFNSLKPLFGCCVHISQRYTVYCFCGLVDPDRNPQGPSPAGVFCSETFNGFPENLPSDSWLCSTWTFSVCIERRAYSIRRGKQQCTVST